MANPRLNKLNLGVWPVGIFLVFLAGSTFFLSEAAQDSEFFGRWYGILFSVNALCILALIGLIAASLLKLIRQYRNQELGAKLTSRLVLVFVLLAVVPASFVYYFSLSFLQRGVDSWFNTQIESSLTDALELSRSALEEHMREVLDEVTGIAGGLPHKASQTTTVRQLNEWQTASGALELTIVSPNGEAIVSSRLANNDISGRPSAGANIFLQIRRGHDYVGLEPVRNYGLLIRVAVALANDDPEKQPNTLQGLFPLDERMGVVAQRVQEAFSAYKGLIYLRGPLKSSFVLTLSLALLQSVLLAVWSAFYFAQRIVAPLRMLALGTRAVAAGNYEHQLPPQRDDEIGTLIQSFNDMTRRVAAARDEAKRNQTRAEEQKAYFETVLGRLSSGVITLEHDGTLRTANNAAEHILGVDLTPYQGHYFTEIAATAPVIGPLTRALQEQIDNAGDWRGEITTQRDGRRILLMCRSSTLPAGEGIDGGIVLVFDDITALIQAEKHAAWAEVARRLAHEIKNPLTPIQLSAEHLRHKYLDKLPPEDAQLLEKSTRTIVNQVDAMKEMLKAFIDYAQVPTLRLQEINLNDLIQDVCHLYKDAGQVRIHFALADNLATINADKLQLRQLLHNLLKNAIEATRAAQGEHVTLRTSSQGDNAVEIMVDDEGPGIAQELFSTIFDPYFTTKAKGTGLGLAIAKKIVDEHSGYIVAENLPSRGARFIVQLPVRGPSTDAWPMRLRESQGF